MPIGQLDLLVTNRLLVICRIGQCTSTTISTGSAKCGDAFCRDAFAAKSPEAGSDHYDGLASGAGSVRALASAFCSDHIYDRFTLCNCKLGNSDH